MDNMTRVHVIFKEGSGFANFVYLSKLEGQEAMLDAVDSLTLKESQALFTMYVEDVKTYE